MEITEIVHGLQKLRLLAQENNMGRDVSGESIDDVIAMIGEAQDEINMLLADDTKAFGVTIGWTEESGNYVEESRTIAVEYVAQIHNEGLSNGRGGYHTEHRYLEQTLDWMNATQIGYFTEVALLYAMGSDVQAVNLLQEIGKRGKDYLQSLIINYDLIDTQRLLNSVIIKYNDKNGNVIGGYDG